MKHIKQWLLNWLIKVFNGQPKRTPWWIEVRTINPDCCYYVGPFEIFEEAREYRARYLDELLDDNTQIVDWEIKQGQHQSLATSQTNKIS